MRGNNVHRSLASVQKGMAVCTSVSGNFKAMDLVRGCSSSVFNSLWFLIPHVRDVAKSAHALQEGKEELMPFNTSFLTGPQSRLKNDDFLTGFRNFHSFHRGIMSSSFRSKLFEATALLNAEHPCENSNDEIDTLEDGDEGFDRPALENTMILGLWNFVRRLPEDQMPVMPSIQAWEKNGNAFTKDLALGLLKKMKQRRKYGHAAELSEWIIKDSGWKLRSTDYKSFMDSCTYAGRIRKAETSFHSFPKEYQTEEVYARMFPFPSRKGHSSKLEKMIAAMTHKYGITPSIITYNSLILCHGRRKDMSKVKEIVEEMRTKGIPRNRKTFNILIDTFGKRGEIQEMLGMVEEMKSAGLEPDSVTYNSMAWSYFTAKDFKAAEEVLQMCRDGPGLTLSTYLSMMWAYSRQGLVEKMEAVFEEMKEKKLPLFRQIWMARIHGHGRAGNVDKALEAFNEMANGFHLPVTMSFNCLLSAYTSNGKMTEAEELLNEMRAQKKFPDAISYQYLIKGYIAAKDYTSAVNVFNRIATRENRNELKPMYPVFVELAEHFVKKGDVEVVDQLMVDAGRMYSLEAEAFNMWLNVYANRKKISSSANEGQMGTVPTSQASPVSNPQETGAAEGTALIHGETVEPGVLKILRKMKKLSFTPTLRILKVLKELGAESLAKDFGWSKKVKGDDLPGLEPVNANQKQVNEFSTGNVETDDAHRHQDLAAPKKSSYEGLILAGFGG